MNELETIFDHGVTEEELGLLFSVPHLKKDKYLEYISTLEKIDQKIYSDLYRLYVIRGNQEYAQRFLDKIDNTIFKYFTLLNHDFAK